MRNPWSDNPGERTMRDIMRAVRDADGDGEDQQWQQWQQQQEQQWQQQEQQQEQQQNDD